MTFNNQWPGLRLNSPQLSEHTTALLAGLGYGEAELQEFVPQQPESNKIAKQAVRCGIKGLKAFHALSPIITGAAATKYIAVQATLKLFSYD